MQTRKLVLAALCAAIPVVLSYPYFSLPITVSGAKPLPWQHMMNVVAGVLLGPWWAALAAGVAAILRNLLGIGTPLAFPGGIPGAIVVGLAYRYWKKKDWVGFLEPLGTGPIGATLAALVVAPVVMKRALPFLTLQAVFLASSILGAILGVAVLQALRRAGVSAQTLAEAR